MTGRNSPCPCGSGKKYKRCHGDSRTKSSSPDPRVLLERAVRLARAGQIDQALSLVGQLPNSPVKYELQIDLLKSRNKQGDSRLAEIACAQWQQLTPESVEPLFRLMQIYWRGRQHHLTPEIDRKIGELNPDHRLTPYYQAVSRQLNGDLEGAIERHRVAVLRNGKRASSRLETDLEVGIATYEVAVGHFAGSPGIDEFALSKTQSAYDILRDAAQSWLDSEPEIKTLGADQVIRYGDALYNLGSVDINRYNGQDDALQHFQNALHVNPDHLMAKANRLFVNNYGHATGNLATLQLHRETFASIRRQLGPPMLAWDNEKNQQRLLRIGYLSSDFYGHAVAHFITPILESHHKQAFEIHAYYTGNRFDTWTDRIKNASQHFIIASDMTDDELHRKIVQDQIDILVDLNGLTKGNRVNVLMRRAAPVQVNWIGYPSTTGMDVMDYRIVDSTTDPQPESVNHNSEKLIYMDPVFSVYLPNAKLPAVAPEAPAMANGYITFGSFNSLSKLNPALLKMWAQILLRVENSKILIKNKMLDQASVRMDISKALEREGIAIERQILLGKTPSPYEHMQTFQRVDLCLDTYPYNGTTTTCDTLIMGVPVVTLAGSRHVSRVTASHLSALDLHELVAHNDAHYIDIAVRVASDLSLLHEVRQGLRERMQQSALMDYQGFTHQLETKYHEIWGHWCTVGASQGGASG